MQALSSIGSFMGGKGGQGILSGAGALENFLAARKKQQYLNSQLAYQKMVQGIISDPAKLMARAKALQSPLDQGLVQGVGNQVQAYSAERGLATSPQIQQAVLAQALGPYIQQNQKDALGEAVSSLGVPIAGSTPPQFDNPLDLSAMLRELLKPSSTTVPLQPVGGSTIPPQDTSPGVAVPPLEVPGGEQPELPNLYPEIPGGGGGPVGNLEDILQFAF